MHRWVVRKKNDLLSILIVDWLLSVNLFKRKQAKKTKETGGCFWQGATAFQHLCHHLGISRETSRQFLNMFVAVKDDTFDRKLGHLQLCVWHQSKVFFYWDLGTFPAVLFVTKTGHLIKPATFQLPDHPLYHLTYHPLKKFKVVTYLWFCRNGLSKHLVQRFSVSFPD